MDDHLSTTFLCAVHSCSFAGLFFASAAASGNLIRRRSGRKTDNTRKKARAANVMPESCTSICQKIMNEHANNTCAAKKVRPTPHPTGKYVTQPLALFQPKLGYKDLTTNLGRPCKMINPKQGSNPKTKDS